MAMFVFFYDGCECLFWSLYVFVCFVLCACVVMGVGFAVYAGIRGWPREREGKKREAEHVEGVCVCLCIHVLETVCVCAREYDVRARARERERANVKRWRLTATFLQSSFSQPRNDAHSSRMSRRDGACLLIGHWHTCKEDAIIIIRCRTDREQNSRQQRGTDRHVSVLEHVPTRACSDW